MPTVTEKIALVVHPIWIYYRQKLCHSIDEKHFPDKIDTGKAQQILDVFPHLDKVQATFLALVVNIISGQDPLE